MFDFLETDSVITISVFGNSPSHFRSMVKSVSSDRLISTIRDEGKLDPGDLTPGTPVKVTYVDNAAIYTFSSEVIAFNQGTPASITLGKPENFMRIQRRNFVRLHIRLKVVSNKLDDNMTPIETFSATTIDISGGGLFFGCNVLLTMGQFLEVNIYLDDTPPVKGVGKIVRVIENSAASKFRYSVGLEFTAIKESERDRIIRFIFNQQRELRNKGLL